MSENEGIERKGKRVNSKCRGERAKEWRERERERGNISSSNSGRNEPSAGEIAALLSDVLYNASAWNHSAYA